MSHSKVSFLHTEIAPAKDDCEEEKTGQEENGATGTEIVNKGSQDINSQESVSDTSVDKVNTPYQSIHSTKRWG